jgi:hypothetical protein
MYSPDELKSLHGFVRTTNEGNLKKMMTGGAMTDVHVNMLVKIARGCTADEFATHFEAQTFPKVKWSSAERGLTEKCYGIFAEACTKLGLLPAAGKKAA